MLKHAVANGRMPWASAQASLPITETQLLLADPCGPGVSGTLADAVQIERKQPPRILAVLRPAPFGPQDYDWVAAEARNLCSVVDVAVMVQCCHQDLSVDWEGLLSPFVQSATSYLDLADLDNAVLSGNATTVGCGLGAPYAMPCWKH